MSAGAVPAAALPGSYGVAMRAFHDRLRKVPRSSELHRSLVLVAVYEQLVRWCFEAGPRRAGRGRACLWFSDVEAATGRKRRRVQWAMAELAGLGLIVGRPNDPDPADGFRRARAVWTLAVPRLLEQLRYRMAWGARKAEMAARTTRNGQRDRAVLPSSTETMTNTRATGPPGDDPPGRPDCRRCGGLGILPVRSGLLELLEPCECRP